MYFIVSMLLNCKNMVIFTLKGRCQLVNVSKGFAPCCFVFCSCTCVFTVYSNFKFYCILVLYETLLATPVQHFSSSTANINKIVGRRIQKVLKLKKKTPWVQTNSIPYPIVVNLSVTRCRSMRLAINMANFHWAIAVWINFISL